MAQANDGGEVVEPVVSIALVVLIALLSYKVGYGRGYESHKAFVLVMLKELRDTATIRAATKENE